jgi:hypothetical protein
MENPFRNNSPIPTKDIQFGTNPPPLPDDLRKANDTSLDPFLSSLDQYNPQLLNADYSSLSNETLQGTNAYNTGIANQLAGLSPAGLGQAQQQTSNIAQTLQGIGAGSADPRFEAYRQAQLSLLENQRQGQLGQASESLSRRGLGGSAAELNAGSAINDQYNQQAQSLSSQLGLQSLGRQDAALQGALGAYGQSANLGLAGTQAQSALLGQQAGLNQQNLANTLAQIQAANQAKSGNLEALTAGLQNLTAPYALETARTAAMNLGKTGGDDGEAWTATSWMNDAFGAGSSDRYGWLDPLTGSVDKIIGGK